MARTRTLAQLRAEVRDRADIENSQHITDAQINRYVNQSAAALHAMLVEACEDYFVTGEGTTAPAPAVSAAGEGSTEIALQATFYKIVAVEAEINGWKTRLQRWVWQTHAALAEVSVGNAPHYYRIANNNYVIQPPLTTGTPVRTYYVPAFVDLVADADTYDGRDGWEEWVVLDAAIKCLLKEESDIRPFVAERDALLARIMQQMQTRDLGRPDRVQDVTGWLTDDTEIGVGRMAPS